MNTPTSTTAQKRKALLLIGSPKGKNSASRAIGGRLLQKLEAAGLGTEEMTVLTALQSTENLHRLHKAVDAADLVIVAFPLYVDQLPAPLVQALELVAERRKGSPGVTPYAGPLVQKLAVIVQCGFFETRQNQPAVDIMRQFAREAGFEWAGALAIGLGGALRGKRLEKAGGMVRNAVKALDRAAASLASGGNILDETAALMAKPMMPIWFYLFMANFGMKSQAKKHGARKKIHARPYAP